MNLEQLTSLLATGTAAAAGPTSGCPDEHRIAGYVDGGLPPPDREQVAAHLADCTHCLELVALLCSTRDAAAAGDPAQHETVIGRTQPLSAPRFERQRWTVPNWAAAAAVLMLAIPLGLQLVRTDRQPGPASGPEQPATRTAVSTRGLQILAPSPGAAVDARPLSIRWTGIPGSPYYDVRIVTDAGDIVTEHRVNGTTWLVPPEIVLEPGNDYFVHVDAYPQGDKAVSSGHVPFRVAEPAR